VQGCELSVARNRKCWLMLDYLCKRVPVHIPLFIEKTSAIRRIKYHLAENLRRNNQTLTKIDINIGKTI
jgi:hypothetical protein